MTLSEQPCIVDLSDLPGPLFMVAVRVHDGLDVGTLSERVLTRQAAFGPYDLGRLAALELARRCHLET